MKSFLARGTLALLLLALVALPGRADPAAERELAEQLLKLMQVEEMAEQAMKEMTEAMPPATSPEETEAREEMLKLVTEAMAWEKVKDDYVAIYVDLFEEEDLRAFNEFFRSPAGQRYIEATPELNRRTTEVRAQRMQAIVPQLQAIMQKHAGKAEGGKAEE